MITDQPLFTHVWENEDDFSPEDGSVYIFASASEDRGRLEADWRSARPTIGFLEVTKQGRWEIEINSGGEPTLLRTRSKVALQEFISKLKPGSSIYLDITGMAHATWAPLLRACLDAGRTVRVIYTEPIDYTKNPAPTEGDIYDLSERIEGIQPIPGFARLSGDTSVGEVFVPLLGFEGTRFAFVRESVQPAGERIIPVIGLPGFRPEFPFASYLGNRPPLLEGRVWKRIRYARANCPFSLYYLLEKLRNEFPGHLLKIAPIGTKPHGLGAVLFALKHSNQTELVYDHPIKKAGRTKGKARLLVYRISEFLS